MKKIIYYALTLSLFFTLSFPNNRVFAEGNDGNFSIVVSGMTLDTEFDKDFVYAEQSSSEDNETVNVFDTASGNMLASLTLDFANQNSRLESSGAYEKYLANGLKVVHAFGYTYTGTSSNKKVTKINWNQTSADGWSFFKKIDGVQSVSIVNSGKLSGSYNIIIQAEVTGSVSVEMKKTLDILGFSGSIKVGSTYTGTKSFNGSWTLNINPKPECVWNGNHWLCPMSN